MTTVHNLTIDVTQILVGHGVVLGEVIVKHITTDGQVTIVEGVELGPTLGAELSATEDKSMEHDQSEDEGLELVVLVGFGPFVECVIELAHGTTQVGLQVLRSLVRNLDGVLEDRLRDDFLVG